jgi:signal transduction histidine kinase
MSFPNLHQRAHWSRFSLIVLVACTIGLLLALAWIDFSWRATVSETHQRNLRVKELQGQIVHLDEVLTMSALMAATSGDQAWEVRYHEFEPQLTRAIEESLLIAPEAGLTATAQTEEANLKLVSLENEAFALVDEDKRPEAQAILTGLEYTSQKQIYAEGMAALDRALDDFVDAANAELFRVGRMHLILNVGVLVFVAVGWSIFFRTILRSEQAIVASHTKLAHVNADLEEMNLHLSNEIEHRKEAEAAQKVLHHKLYEANREAGKAEIATGVLHNVGNALNSVNVAATLALDLMKHSRVSELGRATDLMQQNAESLGDFFTRHERGKLLLPYLTMLGEILGHEQETLVDYLHDLCKKVDHTKQIVKSQQSYAKVCGIEMDFHLEEVLDDVLKTLGANLSQSDIELVRQYQDVPAIHSDKHKIMQVLANLVTNAIHALLSSRQSHKRLTVRLEQLNDDFVSIAVEDNGMGIDEAHLTKIFQYGFTTKETGHGFGLHHSALVAKELGGELRVESDGPGKGARFTLDLPVVSPEQPVIEESELIAVG